MLLCNSFDDLHRLHSLARGDIAGLHLWEPDSRYRYQVWRTQHRSVHQELCLVQLEKLRFVNVRIRIALKVGLQPRVLQKHSQVSRKYDFEPDKPSSSVKL